MPKGAIDFVDLTGDDSSSSSRRSPPKSHNHHSRSYPRSYPPKIKSEPQHPFPSRRPPDPRDTLPSSEDPRRLGSGDLPLPTWLKYDYESAIRRAPRERLNHLMLRLGTLSPAFVRQVMADLAPNVPPRETYQDDYRRSLAQHRQTQNNKQVPSRQNRPGQVKREHNGTGTASVLAPTMVKTERLPSGMESGTLAHKTTSLGRRTLPWNRTSHSEAKPGIKHEQAQQRVLSPIPAPRPSFPSYRAARFQDPTSNQAHPIANSSPTSLSLAERSLPFNNREANLNTFTRAKEQLPTKREPIGPGISGYYPETSSESSDENSDSSLFGGSNDDYGNGDDANEDDNDGDDDGRYDQGFKEESKGNEENESLEGSQVDSELELRKRARSSVGEQWNEQLKRQKFN